jgi:hypothetical protein
MAAEGPIPPWEAIFIKDGTDEHCLGVTEQSLPLLLQLRSLRALDLDVHVRDPSPLIPTLGLLRSLDWTWQRRDTCDVNLLVAALKYGSCLTVFRIYLYHGAFTADLLAAIRPSMPLLETLQMHSNNVTSLSFFSSAPHLHSQLVRLELHHCQLPVSEICFLRASISGDAAPHRWMRAHSPR